MGKVITGARAIFRINGSKVAYASNVSYNEAIAVEDVNVLDKYNPEELAETGYSVDFSCESFVQEEKTIKELGFMPRFQDLMHAGIMTTEIVDHKTEKVLLVLTGVKSLGRSGTLNARGVMTETWNFRGLQEQS